MEKSNKWEGILYPENMRDDWLEVIEDLIPYPISYCIHDKDKEGHDGDRKTHIHMIMVTGDSRNRTTQKHALAVYNRLSKDGKICCSTCQPVFNLPRAYDYLIHDTEKAKKDGKHLYDRSERKCLNCFDIANYETLTDTQKNLMLIELCDMIQEKKIMDISALYSVVRELDTHYFIVFKSYNSILRAMTEGVYHQSDRAKRDDEESKRSAER